YLFNSYYEALGPRHPRPSRGLLTRPSLHDVHAYRDHVDERIKHLFANASLTERAAFEPIAELGLHHEQQHQELILTDIKHALSCNPTLPGYRPPVSDLVPSASHPLGWLDFAGGIVPIGHSGDAFAFDNEG